MKFDISSLQDVRQTPAYAGFMERLGWQVEQAGKTRIFIKRLSVTPFSLIKVLRYQPPLSSRTVARLIRDYRALIIKQEPFLVKKIHGAMTYFSVQRENRWPLLPTKTLWLNLALPSPRLLALMKPKTRYNLGKAERAQLTPRVIPGNSVSPTHLEQFYRLWANNKPHNWLFRPHFNELNSLINAFKEKCYLVLVHKNSQLVAASLQLTSKNMGFYWHNASTKLGKKLFAPTLCLWQAIREAKRCRLKIFDFEGVWDERFPQLNKGWKGFTRFKLGFVGRD